MKLIRVTLFASAVLMSLSGCITGDYDLSKDLETDVCFSSDGFSMGGTNSADVPLSQVIELHDDGQLITDDNGNYLFYKVGDDMEPTSIVVGQGALEQHNDQYFEYHFKTDPTQKIPGRFGITVNFNKDMEIDYHPDTQGKSIRDLSYIKTPMSIAITTSCNELSNIADNVNITYEIPSFYDLKDSKELTTTIYTWEKQHTDTIHLVGVNLKKTGLRDDEQIGFNSSNGKIIMKGKVTMKGSVIVDTEGYNNASDPSIGINLSVGTMGVTEVTGRFDESQDVDLDPITFDDLPDFIRDDEVVIDVENPTVAITLDNEVPADVSMNAVMTSIKDEKKIATLKVGKDYGTGPIMFYGPSFSETTAKRTNVWVTRIPTAIPDSVNKNIVVSNMMDIITKVPDRIVVEANARTDSTKEVTLALAHEYMATPFYVLTAPLKMGPKMKIVYNKDMEDLQKNLKDTNLGEILFTADVTNNIPLSLSVNVTPLDIKGDTISGVEIITPEEIPALSQKSVSFKIKNNSANDMAKIDRIAIKAYATSGESMAGQILNENQNLHIENAKISLKGGSINLNND